MYEFLEIPDKIVVGQRKDESRFTGKISLPTYKISSDKLLKEKSWRSFKDDKLEDLEIDNIPTEGFELNKIPDDPKNKDEWGWIHAVVYDPRGFEVQISYLNLLHIINYCSIKDKKLEGKFVWSWNNKDLMLLSVNSPDYKSSMITKTSTTKVTVRSLVPGATYKSKSGDYIYLGRLTWYFSNEDIRECITFYREDENYETFAEQSVKIFLYEIPGKRLAPMELQNLIKKFQSSRAGNNSPCSKIRPDLNSPDIIKSSGGSLTDTLNRFFEDNPERGYVCITESISDIQILTYTIYRNLVLSSGVDEVTIGENNDIEFVSIYCNEDLGKTYKDIEKRFSENPSNFTISYNLSRKIEIYVDGQWEKYEPRPYSTAFFCKRKN